MIRVRWKLARVIEKQLYIDAPFHPSRDYVNSPNACMHSRMASLASTFDSGELSEIS